jgi:hypothetical protein
MQVRIDSLVFDTSVYPRPAVNEFVIARMLTALQAGAVFPPITIETGTHRVVDGWHRIEMFRRADHSEIEAVEKAYLSEPDLFIDAVRLNIEHGQPLTNYDIRNAIARLQELGCSREQIGDAVRMPLERVDEITKGFAQSTAGEPLALKGGLSHLAGTRLSPRQISAQRRYAGGQATFYARQLIMLLEEDLWRRTPPFETAMDRLCELWQGLRVAEQQQPAE